jgi:hypothetical protein
MRLVRYWCLGLLLGLAAGALPLVGAQIRGPRVDPFDEGISYLVWIGGTFLAASGLAYLLPERRWSWGVAVVSGFLAAMVLEIVIDSYTGRVSHNLWPLTLVFALVMGVPPAFIGAYFGSRLRSRAD